MQIVIDIPKDEYNIAKYGQYGNINVDVVRKAVANGIPLPKGHGRLKDVDDLDVTTIETDDYDGNEVLDVVLKEDIDEAPTIIPADTENGGEE